MMSVSYRRLLIVAGIAAIAAFSSAQAHDDESHTATLEEVERLVRQDPRGAEHLAEGLLRAATETHGAESMDVARVYDLILECRFRSRSKPPEESIELANDVVALKQRVGPAEDPTLSATLYARAILHEQSGNIAAAEADFLAALSNRKTTLGEDHPEVARSHRGLAIFYRNQGKPGKSREQRESALRVAVAAFGEDHVGTSSYRAELASSLIRLGESPAARDQLRRALNAIEASDQPAGPDLVQCLNLLVEIERSETNFDAARELSVEAVEAAREVHGPVSSGYAWVLNSYGLLLAQIGDYRGAQDALSEVLEVRRQVQGPTHPAVGLVLSDLGKVTARQGDNDRAIELYDEAIGIISAVAGEEHPDVAQIRVMLAEVHLARGESAQTIDLLNRSRPALAELDPAGVDVAYCDLFLAQALALENRVEEARSAYQSSEDLLERRFGRRSHHRMASALKFAEAERAWGNPQRAFELALEVEEIMEENLRLNVRTMAERQALRYVAVRPQSLDVLLSLAASETLGQEQLNATLNAVVRSRALVLDELGRRNRGTLESSDPEVVQLADQLSQARQRLAELFVAGRRGEDDVEFERELSAAAAAKELAENALARHSSAFQVEFEQTARGGRDVIDALPPSSALVSFVRFSDSATKIEAYGAFVTNAGNGDSKFVALGNAEQIDGLVRNWKESVTRGGTVSGPFGTNEEERYMQGAETLAAAVWNPVAEHLNGTRQVFVVPDGSLQVLNLATLPASPSQYLVETDLRIHYLSAERDLVPTRERSSARNMLALGNVDFENLNEAEAGVQIAFRGSRSACESLDQMEFDPLPATSVEVEALTKMLASQDFRVTNLLGPNATEPDFKREVAGASVVHLATHGFFLSETCNDELPMVTSENDIPENTALENPLLLSGLVLAGANTRGESNGLDDGILTAEEIAALDLSASEWVVLSACDTGLGIIRGGQGVFGLRRAFALAGARTLIMSLWAVEDQATREYMQGLYDARFLQNMTTAESVRAASLSVLERRRSAGDSTHPFFWGAFVATGDWN